MQITNVMIRKTFPSVPLRAVVSITLDDSIAIHDIKVIEGSKGMFVAMPSTKGKDSVYRDIAHPIDIHTRKVVESAILQAYHHHICEESGHEET